MLILPNVLHGENVNVGHYTQTVEPNFIIPAMFIGTIDFYHFIPFSLTLTLSGYDRVCAKKTPAIGFIFSHTFHLIRMKYDLVMKHSIGTF